MSDDWARKLWFPSVSGEELGNAVRRAAHRHAKNGGPTMKRGTPVYLKGSPKPVAYITTADPDGDVRATVS